MAESHGRRLASLVAARRRSVRSRCGWSVAVTSAVIFVAIAGGAARSLAFVGVQTNVPIASLGGWTQCFSGTYAAGGTELSTLLASCDKAHLMLACRPVGSPTLSLAAHAPRADVLFATGFGNDTHQANGVEWYFNGVRSWGFAPAGDPVTLFTCDLTASSLDPSGADGDKRLCWHTGGNRLQAGWRCGAADSLNASTTYERLVFDIDTLPCGDGTVDFGEECDDGNTTSGDGCDAACAIEPCYACSGQPSSCSLLPDGAACNDGVFCNGADSCSAGTCAVHGSDPCVGGGECADVCDEVHGRCAAPSGTACTDDGNLCTDDMCDGAGSCGHPPNAVPCDDGTFCNGADQCAGGSCSVHPGDPCLVDDCNAICDEMSGSCLPSAANAPCVDDGNDCTANRCDGAGLCTHPPEPNGTPCDDDGQVCTADECNGFGACTHPPRPSGAPCPPDSNVCTKDECNGAGTCAHPPEPDGTACNDGNACTQSDGCEGGQCVGANPVVCPVPACFAPQACNPATGLCSTCPAGYAQGGGGCQRTYAIHDGQLDNLSGACDVTGLDRNNLCAGPFGFHWQDAADDALGDVTRVDVAFTTGMLCDPDTPHAVSLNGTSIGAYSGGLAGCSCPLPRQPRLLSDVDAAAYLKGGLNGVSIDTGDCAGLSQGSDGYFATVTVTYADLSTTYAIHPDCRQSSASKLKYANAAADQKDKLLWRWARGEATTTAELADPTASADYQLCVYAEAGGQPTLLFSAAVPASASCWSPLRSIGYRYTDKSAAHDGVARMLLKQGADSKAKIIVKGAGTALSDPPLPLASIDHVRVQLTNQSTGVCWESAFPVSSISDRINLIGP